MTNATEPQLPTLLEIEVARLRVRMQALEHLVIVLLGATPTRELEMIRGLADDREFQSDANRDAEISQAAALMIHLVERSDGLRSAQG